MLPSSLLSTSHGHQILVELKNGDTYNGNLFNSDARMNLNIRDVYCTSREGDRFWKIPHIFIRGNTIKYLRLEDEVLGQVKEESQDIKKERSGRGRGTRGGRGLGPDRGTGGGRGGKSDRPEKSDRGDKPAKPAGRGDGGGRGRGKDKDGEGRGGRGGRRGGGGRGRGK